jgi:DNA-binding transcriptional ArsR family regulator
MADAPSRSANLQAPIRPVAGATFRHIAALRIEGAKRRKVLALIAAYHDAGAASVSVTQLAARLDLPPRIVGALLQRLSADGYVRRTHNKRQRRYRVAPELQPQTTETVA